MFPTETYPHGAHCDIAEINRLGFQQQKEHLPHWKPYMNATPTHCHKNEGRPVRWHGAGALRWRPLLFGEAVCCEMRNAVIENGSLKPSNPHDFFEAWYHIKLPYYISWLQLDYDVKGQSNDYVGFSISTDGMRSWNGLKSQSNQPHWGTIANGQKEWKNKEFSVQGLREFWLRVDGYSHNTPISLDVDALHISVGFIHNMFLQPMLQPGVNHLWLESSSLGQDIELTAQWIYQEKGMERNTSITLDSTGTTDCIHTVEHDDVSDVIMTGLRLLVIPRAL